MEIDKTKKKIKVVIDTNVFISSFFNRKGAPGKIIDLWKTEKIMLCISSPVLEEYIEVLLRFGLTGKTELKELLDLFQKQFNIHTSTKSARISAVKEDPGDDKFIECAVANNAEFIVSGDKHLLKLGHYKNIKILSPADFINYKLNY